ncbi:MAG: HAD family hydrolase [Halobacteriales archaeon]
MDAVLFDLDDTLCRYRRAGRVVLANAFEAAGVEPCFTIDDYYAVFDDHADEADTMEGQRAACFAALAEEAGRDPELGRAVARAYAVDRDHRNVTFLEGAQAALAALGAERPLGLVTNGAPGMQTTKLEALGIPDAFDTMVFAGYDTAPKPDPEPFRTVIEALGVAPERTVHIGNSIESDVAGANAAGVTSVWLEHESTPPAAAEPDYTVGSLSELTDPPWSTRKPSGNP